MKKLLLFLSACALVFAGDSSRYREDFHYSYPQTAGGRFVLENFNGSVEITGWDQNTVDISGTKYAESESLLNSMHIEASSSGNTVRVKTTRPDPHHGNMGAKCVIRVPRQTALEDVASSNGSLRVDDIDGHAHLATSNGSIHLGRINGNVDAHSSNGSIEVKDVKGDVNFTTSNGGIRARLHDAPSGHPIRLSTSNGDIDLQVDSLHQNDVIATTSNGPITVRMPANVGASLHASTNSNGSVRSDFDVLIHPGELSKHRMEGTIGGGGPKIDLTTSNGNISLLKM
jgi:DUF4097 and DUF4098 domain-containing protein YvlB